MQLDASFPKFLISLSNLPLNRMVCKLLVITTQQNSEFTSSIYTYFHFLNKFYQLNAKMHAEVTISTSFTVKTFHLHLNRYGSFISHTQADIGLGFFPALKQPTVLPPSIFCWLACSFLYSLALIQDEEANAAQLVREAANMLEIEGRLHSSTTEQFNTSYFYLPLTVGLLLYRTQRNKYHLFPTADDDSWQLHTSPPAFAKPDNSTVLLDSLY